MRVLFDARPGDACLTGIGRYARTIAQVLRAGVPGHTVAILARQGDVRLRARCAEEEALELPTVLRRERIDLFHSALFHLPPLLPCPALITLHDAIPLVRPELASAGFRELFERSARDAAARAAAVVCPSESARRDLTTHLGLAPERVQVVPECPARCFLGEPVSGGPDERGEPLPAAPFLLVVGSLEPRKNPGVVLSALALLPPDSRPQLVFAGPFAGYDLMGEVAARGLGRWVRPLGPVADAQLVRLYRGAAAVVVPSRYEGFGLPVIEAFACGAPVVAARAGSLPEVLGEAGLAFDPEDPGELATRLELLLGDPAGAARLARAGRERQQALFSEEAVRAASIALYTRLEVTS